MDRNSLNTEEEWTREFNGTTYIVTLLVEGMTLTLELEDITTTARWSGKFTAEYLLETTQKAGNVKEFPVFIHLLKASLNGGDESAIVDILSFTDLEDLKARKLGLSGGHHSDRSETKDKRYVILTYRTALDKVHYPILLSFENQPNVPALRRTIKSLRAKVYKLESAEPQFNSDIEREMRLTMGRLRQENEELRHRLRQSESRNNKAMNQSLNMSSNNLSGIAGNTDLVATNTKLKAKVDKQKEELSAMSDNYEKLKRKYEVDIAKLKQKIGIPSLASQNQTHSESQTQLMNMVKVLRTRLLESERELRTLKLSVGQPVSRNRSELAKGYAPVYHNRTPDRNTNSRRSRSLSAGRSAMDPTIAWNNASINSSRVSHSNSKYNAHNIPLSGDKREIAVELAYRRQASTPTTSRHSSPALTRHTPPSAGNVSMTSRTPPRGRHTSPSSSSLGGRFDPTAYQHIKTLREKEGSAQKAWGAGNGGSGQKSRYADRSPSPSYRESGYASGGSQSSRGSRHSNGYGSDSSAGSRQSNGSATRKKKAKKAKKSTPPSTAAEKKGSSDYYINSGGMHSDEEQLLRITTKQLQQQQKQEQKFIKSTNKQASKPKQARVSSFDQLVSRAAADIADETMNDDDLTNMVLEQQRQAVAQRSSLSSPLTRRVNNVETRASHESISSRKSTELTQPIVQIPRARSRSNSAESFVSDISHSVAIQQQIDAPVNQNRESFEVRSSRSRKSHEFGKLALQHVNANMKHDISAISVASSAMQEFTQENVIPNNINNNSVRNSIDSTQSDTRKEMNGIDKRIQDLQQYLENARNNLR